MPSRPMVNTGGDTIGPSRKLKMLGRPDSEQGIGPQLQCPPWPAWPRAAADYLECQDILPAWRNLETEELRGLWVEA